jgi:hypothetical protein
MNKSDIATYRLINQQIVGTNYTTPGEIVHWLGAVQAQDYSMAKWAIGLRLPACTDQVIENIINSGDIIRTHILRPTWHFVSATDIRWMLQLTAPHIKRAASYMYRKLDLDDKVFAKANKVFIKSLQNGKQLTRQELTTALNKDSIITNPLRVAHIIFQAELDGILCNGAKRDKQLTYALLDERVPLSTKKLTRAEALAELANRYFSSHGPATLHDFAWWSGLPMADARLGLEQIKSAFIPETIEGKTYWLKNSLPFEKLKSSGTHLLPAFDEFMVSYKDRTASLSPQHNKTTISMNGIFKPIIIVKGKVVGLWKPFIQKGKTKLELKLFDPSCKLSNNQLILSKKKYAAFLNTVIE